MQAIILPNPTKGNLEIKVIQEGIEDNQYQVLIYDVMGREIINEKRNSTSFYLNLLNETPGIYFVKLIAGNKIKEWEIIKE